MKIGRSEWAKILSWGSVPKRNCAVSQIYSGFYVHVQVYFVKWYYGEGKTYFISPISQILPEISTTRTIFIIHIYHQSTASLLKSASHVSSSCLALQEPSLINMMKMAYFVGTGPFCWKLSQFVVYEYCTCIQNIMLCHNI